MRKVIHLLAAFSMAAVLVGCQQSADSPDKEPPADSTQPAEDAQGSVSEEGSSEFTLVSLKVPNMT